MGRGLPTSEKAWGKVPSVEPPPPDMDEQLAWHPQQEEDVADEARRGQDAATLAVVREAAGLLMQGQLEGLGRPSLVAGLSQPPTAVMVQLPVVVAT